MAAPARKKNKEAQPHNVAIETASVRDLVAEASRHAEVAALLRDLRNEIIPRFHDDRGRLPRFLLRRRGAGARPAMTESIVDAEISLERLACEFDERARALLDLRVQLPGHETSVRGDDFMSDEVVDREMLAVELAAAAEKLNPRAPK